MSRKVFKKITSLYNNFETSFDREKKYVLLEKLISKLDEFRDILTKEGESDFVGENIESYKIPQWAKNILIQNLKSLPKLITENNEALCSFWWNNTYEQINLLMLDDSGNYIDDYNFHNSLKLLILLSEESKNKIYDYSIQLLEEKYRFEICNMLKEFYNIDINDEEDITRYRNLYQLTNDKIFELLKNNLESDPLKIMEIIFIQIYSEYFSFNF